MLLKNKISIGHDPNASDPSLKHRIRVTKLLWLLLASVFLSMKSALLNYIA